MLLNLRHRSLYFGRNGAHGRSMTACEPEIAMGGTLSFTEGTLQGFTVHPDGGRSLVHLFVNSRHFYGLGSSCRMYVLAPRKQDSVYYRQEYFCVPLLFLLSFLSFFHLSLYFQVSISSLPKSISKNDDNGLKFKPLSSYRSKASLLLLSVPLLPHQAIGPHFHWTLILALKEFTQYPSIFNGESI